MVNPNEIGLAFDKFFNGTLMSQIITYVGWAFLTIMIIAVFFFTYYWFQFKFKITYPILHYDSDGKSAQILKYKTDRGRMVKKNGIKKVQLLFKRIFIEPFSNDIIKPGNRVNLFSINDDGTYTKMPSLTFNSPAQFTYLSPEEKTWAILELKESASANETPEAAKRLFTYTLITIGLCLVATVVAVYIASKAPNQAAQALSQASNVLENVASKFAPN